MKNVIAIVALCAGMGGAYAQNIKIKKGEILIDKQAVAKIEKQKQRYKISTLDGTTWFVANAVNKTQTNNIAPKFWLELTGANGNLREAEYRDIPFTMSKEKWHVEALLNSDTGLLTTAGVNPQNVEMFFATQDRSVSDKWDQMIGEQRAVNEKEDALAMQEQVVIEGKTIKRAGEKIGFVQTQESPRGSLVYYTYTFNDAAKAKVAQISFYREENLNKDGLFLKLAGGETVQLNQVAYSFSKISFEDLVKRAVNKLYAMGYFQATEDGQQYMNSRVKAMQTL